MMKKTSIVLFGLLASMQLMADDFVTSGDGTTWTFSRLAQTEGSGVSVSEDGKCFTMAESVTVAECDSFALEPSIEVRMADGVCLTLSGRTSLDAGAGRSTFCPTDDDALPYGLWVEGMQRLVVNNVEFSHVGLSSHVAEGIITRCTFTDHNAVSASYALCVGPHLSSYQISDCTFTNCLRSAIGSGANICVNLLVEGCTFMGNGTSNANYPQLNLTVGESVVLRNNIIRGDRSHTMVGGVVVANLMNFSGEMQTLIENNTIEDNRFGVATYVGQNAVIRGNVIRNNNTEVNPMSGGSGINIYDPYYIQKTLIEGNLIEGNLWGITVVGGADVNIGKTGDPSAADYNPGCNTFYNNGFDGQIYDLYNNSTNTVYAQGNYWKTAPQQDAEGIEEVIFHQNDDAQLGVVVFSDWKTDDFSSVSEVSVPVASPQAIWSVRGERITRMQKGISLVRRGGKVVKILK